MEIAAALRDAGREFPADKPLAPLWDAVVLQLIATRVLKWSHNEVVIGTMRAEDLSRLIEQGAPRPSLRRAVEASDRVFVSWNAADDADEQFGQFLWGLPEVRPLAELDKSSRPANAQELVKMTEDFGRVMQDVPLLAAWAAGAVMPLVWQDYRISRGDTWLGEPVAKTVRAELSRGCEGKGARGSWIGGSLPPIIQACGVALDPTVQYTTMSKTCEIAARKASIEENGFTVCAPADSDDASQCDEKEV